METLLCILSQLNIWIDIASTKTNGLLHKVKFANFGQI